MARIDMTSMPRTAGRVRRVGLPLRARARTSPGRGRSDAAYAARFDSKRRQAPIRCEANRSYGARQRSAVPSDPDAELAFRRSPFVRVAMAVLDELVRLRQTSSGLAILDALSLEPMAKTTLSEQERALIEHACARLILESIAANDRQDYEAFAALFTSDGLLHRPNGEPLCGQDEIVESYRSRPRNRITRHICTNILVQVDSPQSARGMTYVVLYSADSLQSVKHFGAKCDPRTLIGELE